MFPEDTHCIINLNNVRLFGTIISTFLHDPKILLQQLMKETALNYDLLFTSTIMVWFLCI
jgi:hypothetical protein